MSLGITVTAQVAKGLKNKVRKDVIESLEGSPEMRKEIRRVFQMANRRIQNVEQAGLFSPAVAALGKGEVKGYSKFSVQGFGNTGDDWKQLKKEYAKAVSFLNQPTSSATGARDFENQVKKQMNVSDDLWKETREALLNNYNDVSSQLLLALPYSDFMQEIYSRAADNTSEQIERDAKEIAEQLQRSIDESADRVANAVEEIENLLNGFKIEI